jgi:hypothetical protein
MDPNRIVAFVYKNTMLALMGQVPDVGMRVIMGSIALSFFGMGSVYLITARLEQMELRTREKLLEIELELQQVAEEVRALLH